MAVSIFSTLGSKKWYSKEGTKRVFIIVVSEEWVDKLQSTWKHAFYAFNLEAGFLDLIRRHAESLDKQNI